jgi:hypothetical protein
MPLPAITPTVAPSIDLIALTRLVRNLHAQGYAPAEIYQVIVHRHAVDLDVLTATLSVLLGRTCAPMKWTREESGTNIKLP